MSIYIFSASKPIFAIMHSSLVHFNVQYFSSYPQLDMTGNPSS